MAPVIRLVEPGLGTDLVDRVVVLPELDEDPGQVPDLGGTALVGLLVFLILALRVRQRPSKRRIID